MRYKRITVLCGHYGSGKTNIAVKMAFDLKNNHKNVAIAKLEGVDTVEMAQSLKNTVLFIKREDAHLPDGEWFISELLGCKVIDNENNEICYGEITDVAETGANDVWYVKTPSGEEVLIPAIPDVIVKCDVANEKIYINALRGLFNED